MTPRLPRFDLDDFAPSMHSIMKWHALLLGAGHFTRKTGWGAPEVWEQIRRGDFHAARTALDLAEAELRDWPCAKVVGIEAGCLLVRCPFCDRIHRTEGLDYGHAESPCSRRGPYLIIDPQMILPYDLAGGRRPVTDEEIPTDTRPRRFR